MIHTTPRLTASVRHGNHDSEDLVSPFQVDSPPSIFPLLGINRGIGIQIRVFVAIDGVGRHKDGGLLTGLPCALPNRRVHTISCGEVGSKYFTVKSLIYEFQIPKLK